MKIERDMQEGREIKMKNREKWKKRMIEMETDRKRESDKQRLKKGRSEWVSETEKELEREKEIKSK